MLDCAIHFSLIYLLKDSSDRVGFFTYIWAVDLSGQKSLPCCMWSAVLSVQGWACVGADGRGKVITRAPGRDEEQEYLWSLIQPSKNEW